jgi:hypothetical protein
MRRKIGYKVLLCIIVVYWFAFEFLKKGISNKTTRLKGVNRIGSWHFNNTAWFYNDGIAQYSVYVVENSSNVWIESLVYIPKNESKLVRSVDLVCEILVLNTGEIRKIKPYKIMHAYNTEIRKVIVHINDEALKNGIAVAILRTKGPNQNFSAQRLVNYQIPDRIVAEKETKKAVGLCITQVRSVLNTLEIYLKMQQDFGVAEIVLHDATSDQSLSTFIENTGDFDFVRVIPFNMNRSIICKQSAMRTPSEEKFSAKCSNIFDEELTLTHLKGDRRLDDVSLNNCYIQLSYKYEFVMVIDLDEYIFPRTMKPKQIYDQVMSEQNITVCDAVNDCQRETPFKRNIYDYIQSIISASTRPSYFSSHYASISFEHAAVLTDDLAHNFTASLRGLVEKLNKSPPNVYPYLHNVSDLVSFEIKADDIDYVNYLLRQNERIQCLLKQMNDAGIIADELQRYMYHILPNYMRYGKCVHLTKNTQMVWAHDGLHQRGIRYHADTKQGDFLPHFRKELNFYLPRNKKKKIITSIRQLNIDEEYVKYMVKKFSNKCDGLQHFP